MYDHDLGDRCNSLQFSEALGCLAKFHGDGL